MMRVVVRHLVVTGYASGISLGGKHHGDQDESPVVRAPGSRLE